MCVCLCIYKDNLTFMFSNYKFTELILSKYAGGLKRFVFKHLILILGTPGKKKIAVRKISDFCMGRIRQLTYSQYARGKIDAVVWEIQCEKHVWLSHVTLKYTVLG